MVLPTLLTVALSTAKFTLTMSLLPLSSCQCLMRESLSVCLEWPVRWSPLSPYHQPVGRSATCRSAEHSGLPRYKREGRGGKPNVRKVYRMQKKIRDSIEWCDFYHFFYSLIAFYHFILYFCTLLKDFWIKYAHLLKYILIIRQ